MLGVFRFVFPSVVNEPSQKKIPKKNIYIYTHKQISEGGAARYEGYRVDVCMYDRTCLEKPPPVGRTDSPACVGGEASSSFDFDFDFGFDFDFDLPPPPNIQLRLSSKLCRLEPTLPSRLRRS